MDNKKASILIVDDIPDNIDVLRGILKTDYKLKIATDGEKALKIAQGKSKPDLILLDIMMPGIDGYEVCKQLKANYSTADIPVIFVTAKGEVKDESRGFDLGAVDYITKPVSPALVSRRVNTHLNLYDQKRLLDEQVKEKTRVIENTRLQIIQRLGRAAEYKDNETGMHVMRMSHYSQVLALASGMSESEAELILSASPMHDIGKIGIADNILLKPGKLDDEEWAVMRKHPEIGAEIIGNNDDSILLNLASEIAISHHEKYNGKGYPNGLKGEYIPISGRIIAIADVFDALTTERPYKKAWTVDDALDLIKQEAGEHFDPELVKVFMNVIPDILELKAKYAEHI
ncbi:MAG: two-component system response regulator [gamma proteobacterium symbiont of Taylorina sp.]|nr:two-component system response regulator [gamma proteobacterium symbiont of Taylorina sp.]